MTALFAQADKASFSVDVALREHWPVLIPALLGFVAILLLLPRARRAPSIYGGLFGGAALALAGMWWIDRNGPLPETILFYAFSGLAILGATLMIAQSNPVHAALSFALVILASCGLFLLLAAPLLMAATIIIYAGAIVVTFLFVIMLAQQAGVGNADLLSREPFLACLAGFVLLITLLTVFERNFDKPLSREALAFSQELHGLSKTAALDDEQVAKARKLTADIQARFGRELPAATDFLKDLSKELEKPEKDPQKIREHASTLSGLLRTYPLLVAEEGTTPMQVNAVLPRENVRAIGKIMFTEYLLAFELAGVLLLVATIGAIVVAGRRSTEDLK